MNNLLITICARGGSKGVKNKNIRMLDGKPLIAYSILQAQKWGKAKHIIVSTDSKAIAKVARQFGAEVPFLRPAELATDTAAKIPVIRHVLLSCEETFKENYDYVMDLDATAPVRKVEDLENALNLFLEKRPKTLFSVVSAHRNPYFNMVEEDSEGKVNYSKPNAKYNRRQDAPKVYDMNASIYIYDRKYLLDNKNDKPVSNDSIIYLMDNISRTDVDSELDFKFIEFLIKESIITL